ncbi:MAG: hypothetical protein NWQ69_10640 [Paracoccaceae bacterium]|nr:hypothetical protein [Paracoccaceae bacterium]
MSHTPLDQECPESAALIDHLKQDDAYFCKFGVKISCDQPHSPSGS